MTIEIIYITIGFALLISRHAIKKGRMAVEKLKA
jgi:hypothetical protein